MTSVKSWRRGISPNVLILGLVSLLNDAASEMIYPLLPLFLTAVLGAGPAALGVIEGIAESTASLLKLISGYLSDRIRRRKGWVLAGYALSTLARPLIGLATAWSGVMGLRVIDRVGKGLRSSPRDALIAESTPPQQHGRAFGFHRAADHAGAVIGPLVAAALIGWFMLDLRTLFFLALIPGLLAVGLVAVGVSESRHPLVAEPHAPPVQVAAAWAGMPAPLRRFMLILLIFTLGNSSDAFLLLKAQQLGVSVPLIPLLWVALHLVKMGSSLPAGIVSDRVGRKGVILGGWAIYAATYAGFMVADVAWHVWLLFTVYGLYFGLTEGAEKALIADLAPAPLRGSAFGLYHLTVGIGMLPASLLFGWLWQQYGDEVAFGAGAGLSLIAGLLLWLLPITRRH